MLSLALQYRPQQKLPDRRKSLLSTAWHRYIDQHQPGGAACDRTSQLRRLCQGLIVSIESVRVDAVRDADLPRRVNADTQRSPLFRAEQLKEYRRQKRDRSRGRAGHPPRVRDVSDGVFCGRSAGDLVRELIVTPDAPVSDVRALEGLPHLEVPALHYRLRGQTRWKPAELEAIARVFRVSVQSLTVEPTLV